ncbi:hypothetical protein IE4803_PA00122 (plasmid) [Rhizobium etli bv. phaseoli str. IE4803]|nr:hypothetical protein IE4803_PA00122 [Rhizobium etli bv. phaseoli str. IE4803]
MNDADRVAHLDVGMVGKAELQIKLASVVGVTGSTVLAYGYAFEGHCYRLDSNRIFVVTGPSAKPAVGCGFEANMGYKMWRLTASSQLLEISTNFADARALILDAQLPGKRSPNAYAITLRTAHRNGRLSND